MADLIRIHPSLFVAYSFANRLDLV